MALDSDSKGFLEDVKKGKPRRFVMICKGVQIQSLIIYKKGTVEKYKKQAKEEGRGQFYHGVVDGKGMDIRFNLLRSDGFEKPPGKDFILKDYLRTEGGGNFKPTYQVVDALPDVDESDDAALVPEAPPLPETEMPPAAPATSEPSSGASDEATFKKRLSAILPEVKPAMAGTSPEAEKLRSIAAKVQLLGKERKFDEAVIALDELEKVLRAVQPSGESIPAAPPQPPASGGAESQPFSIVNVQGSRLAWDATRKKVQTELQTLEKAILAAVEQHNAEEDAEVEFEMGEVAAGAKQLYEILDALDTRLIDKLDEALNAEGEARAARHKEAKEIIKEYQQFVAHDPLMAVIDDNPFVDATIRQTVDRTLGVLASKI